MTLVVNFPPVLQVLLTPVANNKTAYLLKVNFIYVLIFLPKGVKKYLKLFWLKIFSICHQCQRHQGSTFELRLSGETDSWKNLKSKISWHCSFNRSTVPGCTERFLSASGSFLEGGGGGGGEDGTTKHSYLQYLNKGDDRREFEYRNYWRMLDPLESQVEADRYIE